MDYPPALVLRRPTGLRRRTNCDTNPVANSNNRTNRIAYHTGDYRAGYGACADRCRSVKACEGSHADAGSAHVYFSAAN